MSRDDDAHRSRVDELYRRAPFIQALGMRVGSATRGSVTALLPVLVAEATVTLAVVPADVGASGQGASR